MAKSQQLGNLTISNARVLFRNFSGNADRYNPAGRRNFCVLLDPENMVEDLVRDGWNVKYLQPREEGDDPQPYLQVAVNYNNIPPRIVMVTARGKTQLDEEAVGLLDYADLRNVDLIIRPYLWDVNGKTGVKAYVKTLFAVLEEDELERKYYDVPDADANDSALDETEE